MSLMGPVSACLSTRIRTVPSPPPPSSPPPPQAVSVSAPAVTAASAARARRRCCPARVMTPPRVPGAAGRPRGLDDWQPHPHGGAASVAPPRERDRDDRDLAGGEVLLGRSVERVGARP